MDLKLSLDVLLLSDYVSLPRRSTYWESNTESMIPYFGRNGAEQYICGNPIKFRYKMWIQSTWLGYVNRFYQYLGAGRTDKKLGLGGPVVHSLTKDLSMQQDSSYHITFNNLFTSPRLLRPHSAKRPETLKKEPHRSHEVGWTRNLECAWFIGMTAK